MINERDAGDSSRLEEWRATSGGKPVPRGWRLVKTLNGQDVLQALRGAGAVREETTPRATKYTYLLESEGPP